MADTDEVLLGKIKHAVAEHNAAEKAQEATHAHLVSKSKEVGLLLLEAKKRHPKVADFEAFLKRVHGLKLSRAYDLLRLAGGRTTDEELRQDARERVRKHRAKKKLPKPEPISVTDPDVTESPKRITQSPEVSADERRAQNAALDTVPAETDDLSIPPFLDRTNDAEQKQSAYYRDKFIEACRTCLPKIIDESDREAVIFAWTLAMEDWKARFGKKARRAA
jgi:hypothetical protein